MHMGKKLKTRTLPELNEAYQKVMIWFFSFPLREIGLNDLAEAVSISKTTAKKIVETLVSEGFLKKDVLGKVWRITCNQKHLYNYSRKIAYNLHMGSESVVIEKIRERVKSFRAIILFGSYRRGDDTEKSDIDLAVEVFDNHMEIIELGVLPLFGYRKDVKVNVHVFSRNKIDINLFSNIANGIVLEGFLEVKP